MELLDNLALGFSTALLVENVLYCFVGVLLGTAVGVLPGIGPTATVAMLLPITFSFEPVTALIMLAGIYYGAQYGGSTTAILINLPGESSAAVTVPDCRIDASVCPSITMRAAPNWPASLPPSSITNGAFGSYSSWMVFPSTALSTFFSMSSEFGKNWMTIVFVRISLLSACTAVAEVGTNCTWYSFFWLA